MGQRESFKYTNKHNYTYRLEINFLIEYARNSQANQMC